MKKVISLFLTLAMLLSIVSVVDFSAFADVQTGKCGENVTYSIDTETGELTISGKGTMANYSLNNSPFYHNSDIKTITISSGVTSIGNVVFKYCTSLTSVTIPDSVTSIGSGAFEDCTNLTSVTIPDSVTSIGDAAFYGCTSLTSVTIPDSVTSIGWHAFESCTSLTSITIPNSVTSIGYQAFYSCDNLTNITVNSNNSNYSSQDGVLFDKSKTTLIQYPTGNTRTSYTIPNSVISIGRYAFHCCTSLTSISISDSVTSIGDHAFWDCKSLTSVTIPNSVTRIGDYAFYLCTSLEDVYYLGTKAEWNSIYIKDDNDCLINATLHFIDDVNPQPTPQPNPQPNPQPSVPVPQPQPTPQPSVPVTQPQQTTQPMTVPTVTTTQDSTTTKTAVALPSGCTVVGGEYISSKLKKPTIKKVTKGKKKVTVQWKKVSGVSGYEIQVATDKKFKKNKKTVTIKKQKTTKTTVKKLKAKKKYFVRVRTYKTVNGKKVYSSWSKVKSVKTK